MKIADFSKNTNPSLTVLYVSSVIVNAFSSNEVIPYTELQGIITSTISDKAIPLIPYALSFLYTVNKIDYIQELDSFKRV